MKRWSAALMTLAAVSGAIAYACADGGYDTSWDAEKSSAILSPANDTRTNLFLLLADRQGGVTANPETMAKGIVPFEFPWRIMEARLLPPPKTDEERASNYYPAEADGSRCHSNAAGADAFIAAVNSDMDVTDAERAALVRAREALRGRCDDTAKAEIGVSKDGSSSSRAFAHYLDGTRQFYAGSFPAALGAFRAAAGFKQAWVRETATYMIARSALNQAQQSSFDEYGSLAEPAKRDIGAIDAAGQAFGAYLQAYPNGRYADSARGLLRRVAWLKNDQQALGTAYSGLLNQAVARSGDVPSTGLIEEIDLKFLPDGNDAGVRDPVLLAVIDLMRLRDDGSSGTYPGDYRGPRLERAELERQRPLFQSDPALFDYILAAEAFYGRKQAKEVLRLIPDAAHQPGFTYLQFSRQMLRGFALEALKDGNARGFWISLLPGANRPYQREAVELALANHDGTAGRAERLFAADSPLRHPLIRQHLLEASAGPALLRQQARSGISTHERNISLYLLLAGDLHHGLYADFLKDAAMVTAAPRPKESEYYWNWSVDDYDPIYTDAMGEPPLHVFAAGGSSDLAPCPEIRATAGALAANPAAIRPRLCLAEFIRRKGFDQWNERHEGPDYHLVTKARNGFPGRPLERIDIYRSVMAAPAATADDKAFALNRAIRCFAPAGYSSCGGNDISKDQRRAWFERLKRDYPQSTWARDLKFYW